MKNKRIISALMAALMVLSGFTGPVQAIAANPLGISVNGAISPDTANVRKTLNFNSEWKFIRGDVTGAADIDYDETSAEDVNLPHSREHWDLYECDRSLLENVDWYRRHFSLDAADSDDHVVVEFDGGGQINDVYVNGRYVGQAKGHFTHFSFDITDYVTFNDATTQYDNVISVRVDSNYHNGELPPGDGHDYQMFGGLHGAARMVIVDRAYVDSVFYYNDAITITSTTAAVKGEIDVKNTYTTPVSLQVKSELRDADDNTVATNTADLELGVGVTAKARTALNVENPNLHLWSPDSPYLYNMVTTVLVKDTGLVLDTYETNIGIRTFTAYPATNDPAKGEPVGFVLNGEPFEVGGTSMHMQAPYLGNARNARLSVRDAHLLKDTLGVNMVRTSHYQQDPAFLAECDKIGLLVEEEAMGWGSCPDWDQFVYSVEEMVKRDRNHPSIVMWSILGNERPASSNPGFAERQALNTAVKALDPTRLTAQEESNNAKLATDVYGWHDYNRPNAGIKLPGDKDVKNWMVTEWNNDAGRIFLTPGDSELRKLKQLLSYSRELERFQNDNRITGNLYWTSTCYMTKNQPYETGKVEGNLRCGGAIGPMRDELDMRWWAYELRAQSHNAEVKPVLKINTEWKNDSAGISGAPVSQYDPAGGYIYPDPVPGPNKIYVSSTYDQVKLYYMDGDTKKLIGDLSASNRNSMMNSGLFEFVVEPVNYPWTATSSLVAEGYTAGERKEIAIQHASTIDVEKDGAQLILHDTLTNKCGLGSIQSDGSDAAWILAEIVDKNGQREYYADENITASKKSGAGEVFFGGDRLLMNDGLAGFYIRPYLDVPGDTTAEVKVDIGKSVDDTDASFVYSGDWVEVKNEKALDSFGGSYHQSETPGSSVTITFTGKQFALYGEYNPLEVTDNKIQPKDNATVSIDGGAPENVCFISKTKYGTLSNQRIYLSPVLATDGPHTITLTVGSQDKAGGTVRLDRVKVFDGQADLTQTITVAAVADAQRAERVALPAQDAEKAPQPQMSKAALLLIIADAERLCDKRIYTEATVDVLLEVIDAAKVIAESPDSVGADFEAQAALIDAAVAALELQPENKTKAGLQALVDEVTALDLTPYTVATLKAMKEKLAAANVVLGNTDATADDCGDAYQALADARAALTPILPLITKIDHLADKTNTEGQPGKVYYWSKNPDVWLTPTNGTASAEKYTYTAKNPRTAGDYYSIAFVGTQVEIWTIMKENHGIGSISIDDGEAIEVDFWKDLPKGDDTATMSLAYRSESLTPGPHTVKVTFLNKLSPSQAPALQNSCVSFAYANITTAGIENPEVELAKSALYELIMEAESLDRDLYSADSLRAVDEAVAAANPLIDAPGTTLEDLNNAKEALRTALDALGTNPDIKANLERQVAAMQAVRSDMYTVCSYMMLQDQIADTLVVLNAPDTAAEDLLEAGNALRSAFEGLETLEVYSSKVNNTDTTSTEGTLNKVFFKNGTGGTWVARVDTKLSNPLPWGDKPIPGVGDSAGYSLTFTGTQMVQIWNDCMRNMGQGAVSIDGGEEVLVDFWADRQTNAGNPPLLVYGSPMLDPDVQHTIKVRRTYVATGDSGNAGNARSAIGLNYFELINFSPNQLEETRHALLATALEWMSVDRSLYTAESLVALDSSLATVNSILREPTANQEDVDGAVSALQAAIDALVFAEAGDVTIVGYYADENDTALTTVAEVDYNTTESDALAELSSTGFAKLSNGSYVAITISWSFDDGYDGTVSGEKAVTGTVIGDFPLGLSPDALSGHITVAEASDDAALKSLSYSVAEGDSIAIVPIAEEMSVVLPGSASPESVITLTTVSNDAKAAITLNEGCTLVDGTGTAAIEVTAEDGTVETYTVNFTIADENTYIVSVLATANGVVSASPAGAAEGEEITLTAFPESGYKLSALSVLDGSGEPVALEGADNTHVFTMPASDVTVTAQFELIPPVAVTGVTLDRNAADLYAGSTLRLTATVEPDDAENKDVVWTSGDEAIATVDQTGLVTAVAGGEVAITATSAENDNLSASCVITVTTYVAPPSGGGSTNTITKTEKNEDGSTTKTVTNKKTGEVIATTSYPDGTKIVATTPKDGKVTIEATVPKDKEKVTVTIPTGEQPKPGEVAVILREDGTREIVKTSVSVKGGLRVTLTGNVKLEIVDNSKTFADVPVDHWGADAIAFVTSRELFNGGNGGFKPTEDMSRAMLFTVLARLDGQDPTGGRTWYENAMLWAKESGISDGTNPEASITRESLAVMLYRYAGAEKIENDLKEFVDAGSVSDWAAEAMAWAVESGIINGANGKITPNATASRAEVATVLQRFITAVQ